MIFAANHLHWCKNAVFLANCLAGTNIPNHYIQVTRQRPKLQLQMTTNVYKTKTNETKSLVQATVTPSDHRLILQTPESTQSTLLKCTDAWFFQMQCSSLLTAVPWRLHLWFGWL